MQIVHAYLVIMAVVVFLLIVPPLPVFSSERELPMFIVYSFEWTYKDLMYWLIYSPLAVQIILMFVVNLLTVIIWYVMLNFSIKYQVLGNQLTNLGMPKYSDIDIATLPTPEDDLFYLELIASVEKHQNIFEMIERFRCSFSGIFVAQIAASCISICSSNYILT
ncbi:hypothetical protein Bhyg_13843, partial [Pseudolycoriella hygida]